MIKFTINHCKPKPTGNIFHNKDKTKYWISQGSEYINWKSKEAKRIQDSLLLKPLNRVYGVIAHISIHPSRKGHPPDLYNLIGSVADVITLAGLWTDDHINVSDLLYTRVVRNCEEITRVIVCETYDEFIGLIQKDLPLLK